MKLYMHPDTIAKVGGQMVAQENAWILFGPHVQVVADKYMPPDTMIEGRHDPLSKDFYGKGLPLGYGSDTLHKSAATEEPLVRNVADD